MKFGIYLGYAPEQAIKNQGIGRLMAFIIKGAIAAKKEPFTIACPRWYIKNLHELLNDFEIELNQVKIITTKNIPVAIRIRNKLLGNENLSLVKIMLRFFKRTERFLKRKLFNQFIIFLASSGFFEVLFNFLHMLPLIFLSAFFLPIVIFKKIITKTSTVLTKRWTFFTLLKQWCITPISVLKSDKVARASYEEIRKKEFIRLNEVVNKQKDISVWYVPSLFWPEIAGVNAKKIIAAPDAVYLEFPTHFANCYFYEVDKQIRKSTEAANSLICYSDYIKFKHFVKGFNLDAGNIKTIHHGWIDLSEFLKINNVVCRNKATQLVNEWIQKEYPSDIWFRNFNFGNINYFFYASQERPHKNFFHLIKAYEYLLRKKYINAKLVITAAITDKDLIQYIYDRRLQFEIIQLHNVPTSVLAALNALADCAVNPTYFEGGFPFTFSEAYSVGTPSVMSDIPVVQEIIDDAKLGKTMLFDPMDYKDIAEKMLWAFQNRDELLELQAPLAEKLSERSWGKVAGEYIEAMEILCANE